jgi:hypothetical protein
MGKAKKPLFARRMSDREFEEKPNLDEERSEVEQSDDRDKIQISDDRDAEIVVALAEQVIEVAESHGEHVWQSIEQTVRDDGSIATVVGNRWSEDTAEEDEPEGIRTLAVYPRPTPLVPYQPPQQPLWDDDDLDDPDIEDIEDGAPTHLMLASPAEREESFNPLIDWALGQRGDGIDQMLRVIVERVEGNEAPLNWRQIVERRLPPHVVRRLDHAFKLDFHGQERSAKAPGHNSKPIGQLTIDYRGAIWRAAEKIVSTSNAWFDTAFNAGLDASEKAERTFDPTLGWTFWTHAKLRVEGAMKNALERQIRTMACDDAAPGAMIAAATERWKWEAHGKRSKQNRTSTGAKVEKTYAEIGKPSDPSNWSKSILIQANPADEKVQAALGKLSQNQRVV